MSTTSCNTAQISLGVIRVSLAASTLIIGGVLLIVFYKSFDSRASTQTDTTPYKTVSRKIQDEKLERYLKYLGISAILGCITGSICYSCRFIINCTSNGGIDNTTREILVVGALTSNVVVNFSLFCIFVIRLLYCFQDTSYAATK